MRACSFNEHGVKHDLDHDVEEMDACERELIDHHGPYCVEEDLEGAEESLPEYRVQE
jgi:hypothetical protein